MGFRNTVQLFYVDKGHIHVIYWKNDEMQRDRNIHHNTRDSNPGTNAVSLITSAHFR